MAEDAVIAERVKAAIDRDETLRAMDIHVDVENGVVTLKGTVNTEESRQIAAGLAGTSGDVQMVVNCLVS